MSAEDRISPLFPTARHAPPPRAHAPRTHAAAAPRAPGSGRTGPQTPRLPEGAKSRAAPAWRLRGPLRTRVASGPRGGGATPGPAPASLEGGGASRAAPNPVPSLSGIPDGVRPQSPPAGHAFAGQTAATAHYGPPGAPGTQLTSGGPFSTRGFLPPFRSDSVNRCPTQLTHLWHPGNYHSLPSPKVSTICPPALRPPPTNVLDARHSIADSKIKSHQLCDHAQVLI